MKCIWKMTSPLKIIWICQEDCMFLQNKQHGRSHIFCPFQVQKRIQIRWNKVERKQWNTEYKIWSWATTSNCFCPCWAEEFFYSIKTLIEISYWKAQRLYKVLFVITWGFSPKMITNEVCNTMFLLFLRFVEDVAKIVRNKWSCAGIFKIENIGFLSWASWKVETRYYEFSEYVINCSSL